MVTRSEGYRRGVPKEEAALQVVESFFERELSVRLERITNREENYRQGDFRVNGSEATIECKGQPIDPVRYPQNFVEVFEITSNPRHEGGLTRVAEILGVPVDDISEARVKNRGVRVGGPQCVSVSVTPISGSAATAYVNAADGGRHLYLYARDELLQACRQAAIGEGFVRGAGRSNEDTFAVFVPLPRLRWQRHDGNWEFRGDSQAESAEAVRTLLGL